MRLLTVLYLFAGMWLQAQSYKEFRQEALRKNPTLRSLQSDVEVVRLNARIQTRLQNPSLEISAGSLDLEGRSLRRYGGGAKFTQTLRLPKYQDALKQSEAARYELEKVRLDFERARFLYMLDRYYIDYRYAVDLSKALKRSEANALSLYLSVQKRFEQGGVSQAELEGAHAHYLEAKQERIAQESNIIEAKNALLRFAKLPDRSILPTHRFRACKTQKENLFLRVLKGELALRKAQKRQQSALFKEVDVFGSLERDIESDRLMVGFEFALPLWHRNDQERQIAEIKLASADQNLKSEQENIGYEIKRLGRLIDTKRKNLRELAKLRKVQKRVFERYKEGYDLAQTGFVRMMSAKEALSQSERTSVSLQRQIDMLTVERCFLQGGYDEKSK